jgi:PII-like signaling protein
MKELSGEHVLLRILIGESDKTGGKPTYQVLVEMFRRANISGATVLRGVMGYGAHSHPHTTSILRLSQDLPIVIEVVDSQENIERVLPQIEQAVQGGLITLEKVRVIKYAGGN